MKKNQRGFTIIELIVVIAVIAVLAAIIVTNVSIYTNKAKGTAFRASVNEFIKAVKLKKADTNSLTTSMIYRTNPEQPWSPWDSSPYKTTFTTNFGNYISDFPNPPFVGSIYYYYYAGGPCDGSPYMLLIYGAQNKSFFSDWITWPANSNYKCFPLD